MIMTMTSNGPDPADHVHTSECPPMQSVEDDKHVPCIVAHHVSAKTAVYKDFKGCAGT